MSLELLFYLSAHFLSWGNMNPFGAITC